MDTEDMRDRAAELLGWKREDVDKFSIPTLREMVKGKDPEFDAAMNETMETKAHFFTRMD